MTATTFKVNRFLHIGAVFYVLLFLTGYVIVPYVTVFDLFPDLVSKLIFLSLVSVFCVLAGIYGSVGFRLTRYVVKINFDAVLYLFFSLFLLTVLVIIVTAPSIPILESFRGASEQDLNIHREEFLKARTGWESYLVYVIETLNGVIPYLIAYAYLKDHRFRHSLALIFFLYCICFLAKAYFIKIAVPLFFVLLYKSENKKLFLLKGALVMSGLIFFMYVIAGSQGYDQTRDETFFSILYLPSSTYETIIWRSLVVPIITSLDGIRLFSEDFSSKSFYGDTSSFIAFLKGSPRINFERVVYQDQFGGSETGTSNAYFVIEAYINFGIAGVVIASLIVGRILRFFILSRDIALISLIPLFIFNLYSAGLIGLLLSSGWLLLILMVRYLRLSDHSQGLLTKS